MSTRTTIYNALPIVAAAYGEKFGVKVSIGGDTAYTDGKTIVVPNIPESYPHKDALWGYLAHEAAHVRFTDFSVPRRAGIHADLSNIFEDCRIEKGMINAYPGTSTTLHETARYMAQAGHYQHATPEDHPASILEAYCLYWLQSQAVGQSVLQPYLNSAKSVFESTFPRGVVVRLNALLRKVVDSQSTAEVIELTELVMKMLKEEKEKEGEKQPDNPVSNDQSQSSGDDSSDDPDQQQGQGSGDDPDQQQGQGSGDDSGQQQGQGSGDDSGQQQGQSPSNGSGGGSDQSSLPGDATGQNASTTSAQKPDDGSASKLIEQVLAAKGDQLLGDAHASLKQELLSVARNEGDASYQTVRTALPSNNHPHGRSLVDEVKSTTSKIRSQLHGLVQASQRSGAHRTRSGKRLDTNNIHRVVSGDMRIFRSPIERQRPNTAVHILVDMSSSMNNKVGSKRLSDVASESALALALALQPIPGVNPAVTYFMGGNIPVRSVVKHGENVMQQAGRFIHTPTSSTPMAEAIWYSAYELTKTREAKKVMVVLTDGEPDSHAPCKAVIDLCEKSGIEMYGIGIKTASVDALFKQNIVINDVSDLQRTLFKLVGQSLINPAA
jgi:hypothetical protein